jgi:hypothetical protein
VGDIAGASKPIITCQPNSVAGLRDVFSEYLFRNRTFSQPHLLLQQQLNMTGAVRRSGYGDHQAYADAQFMANADGETNMCAAPEPSASVKSDGQ